MKIEQILYGDVLPKAQLCIWVTDGEGQRVIDPLREVCSLLLKASP